MRNKTGLIWLVATTLLLPSAGTAQQPIQWEPTLESAQRLAGQTNRLVLIHFWAPWCGVCKSMEAEVLTQPSVAAALASDYVAVKINADNFPATAQRYGVAGLPSTVIITPQGQPVEIMRGRVEAAEYAARLSRVAVAAKQRGATYAQIPAGTAPSSASNPSAATPAQPSMVGAQPLSLNGPSLGVSTPPSRAGNQSPGSSSGLSDDRYADYYRRNQAAVPSGNPDFRRPQASPVAQAYPPSQPLAGPAPSMGQSPAPAAVASAYGLQSRSPLAQPAANPSPGAPMLPSPVGSSTSQSPAINPPLGLDGFCPVTLVDKQQWTVGDRRWGMIHRGRTYLFASAEEQRRFYADPDRYAPINLGNDVVLATEGQMVPGMREHGVFFGNRVYLFSSEATLEKFAKNPTLYVNQAPGAFRTGAYAGQPLR